MHRLRHMCRSWKHSRNFAYSGALSSKWTNARSDHNSSLNPDRRQRPAMESRGHHRHGSSASFGVRRPLRYLSYQLDLDEAQARKVASILNRLKTEQEQAALDHKRTVTAVADLMSGSMPLAEELTVALSPRKQSEERMQGEVRAAIQALHEALDQDQRERLADLMLAGSFSL